MRCAVFVFVLAIGSSLAFGDALAQDSLTGKWAAAGAAAEGVTDGGGTWSRRAIAGTLDLTQSGADVTGSWSGPQGPAWQVTGRVQSGKFELRTETRHLPVVIDGAQTTVAMQWTFRGTADGDTLAGTMALHPTEDQPAFDQPLTAQRK